MQSGAAMRHFDIMQWADYARNLGPVDLSQAMDLHLADCPDCGATVALLRKVSEVAQGTTTVDVPAPLVASARDVFRAPVQMVAPFLRRLVARLAFNPLLEPLPAGVRSEHRPVRQLLYHAGDYSVDLRMDLERDSTAVTLVGQIANQAVPEHVPGRTPVFLMSGKRVVSTTICNDFGEFCLECTPKSNLRLCLPLTECGVQVEVSLNRLISGQ
jgi:hypothetical protein